MPVDIYYTPKDDAQPPNLADVHQRFIEAGIHCIVEADPDTADMQWFVFEPKSTTTICASVKDEHVVFVTVHAAYDDEPEFVETLDQVLEDSGLSSRDSDLT